MLGLVRTYDLIEYLKIGLYLKNNNDFMVVKFE